MACIWFYSSCTFIHDKPNECNRNDTWIDTDAVIDLSSKVSCYFRSLYYVTQTFFTIGFGDSKPLRDDEIVLNLFMMLNASLFVASLFSYIIAYISNKEIITKEFRESVSKLKKYLQLRHLPDEFIEETNHFFDFIFSRQYGILEDVILKKLPRSLRSNIMIEVGQQLKLVPFFMNQDPAFIDICINKLAFRTFVPKSMMYSSDDKTSDLILVRTGRIDIYSHSSDTSNDITLLSLLPGDHFGDFNLIFDLNDDKVNVFVDGEKFSSNVSLITSTFTETLVLTRDSLIEAIEEYLIASRNQDDTHTMNYSDFFSDDKQQQQMKLTAMKNLEFQKKLSKAFDTIESSSKNKKIMGMMQVLEQKDNSLVILPGSKFRLLWDTLCAFGNTNIKINN